MLNAEFIKQKAKEFGATICGIGNPELFRGDDPQRNPYSILPNAKSIIGFGIKIPRGLYNAMDIKSQYYNYTNLGVKYIEPEAPKPTTPSAKEYTINVAKLKADGYTKIILEV